MMERFRRSRSWRHLKASRRNLTQLVHKMMLMLMMMIIMITTSKIRSLIQQRKLYQTQSTYPTTMFHPIRMKRQTTAKVRILTSPTHRSRRRKLPQSPTTTMTTTTTTTQRNSSESNPSFDPPHPIDALRPKPSTTKATSPMPRTHFARRRPCWTRPPPCFLLRGCRTRTTATTTNASRWRGPRAVSTRRCVCSRTDGRASAWRRVRTCWRMG
mmetsp:Transcript_4053/g.7743  ORF Transcript_4053/g.7743 Transcript_4053/m.7743 type:complete len:213 (+) Transcript_4053:753-1391(+)